MNTKTEVQEIRDDVYDKTTDPPRASPEWIQTALNFFNTYLKENIRGKHVLEYGCGNGEIGKYFLEKGAHVDFVEVANKMLEFLRNKYGYPKALGKVLDEEKSRGQARIFGAESPKDLPIKNETYDYIVVRSVLHHVNPNKWKEFIDTFGDLLKKDGKLFIVGIDETDSRLQEPGFNAFLTKKPIYPINSLQEHLEDKNFVIENTGTYDKIVKDLDTVKKTFRYFIATKKK